jgi:spore coat protein U-like protein
MKKYRILLIITLMAAFLLATTQALASSENTPSAKKTPFPVTPGAYATEKANDNATKQAGKPPHGKHENYKGTVAAVDATSITLTLRDGSSVTIGLNAETRMKFPGPKDSRPATIQVGMNAMVQAYRDQSSNLIARAVMVIPGKPSRIHRVGIVTEYTAGSSITIQDKDGNTYNFAITAEAKLLPAERAGTLAVGSRVTIIAPRDPATGGVTVKGIVIHPAQP